MTEELVILKDKQAVTTSLQVAKVFDKRHDHILRDIDDIKKDVPNFGGEWNVFQRNLYRC